MMLAIPEVLSAEQLAALRAVLEQAPWADGLATAGAQAGEIKRNLQLPRESEPSIRLGQIITAALHQQALFISATLPKVILPPLFNRYAGGGFYGNHVDSAIHQDMSRQLSARTDISITVFLNDPAEYDGGELIVEDTYGAHEVKLSAGDAIIYSATSLHRVMPVTRGIRLASFLWVQSMVKDDWQRTMLFNLDMTIQKLRAQLGDNEELVALTSHYHNLLRQWADL